MVGLGSRGPVLDDGGYVCALVALRAAKSGYLWPVVCCLYSGFGAKRAPGHVGGPRHIRGVNTRRITCVEDIDAQRCTRDDCAALNHSAKYAIKADQAHSLLPAFSIVPVPTQLCVRRIVAVWRIAPDVRVDASGVAV